MKNKIFRHRRLKITHLIEITEENEDNRSYNVSAEKIKQVGFSPSKTLIDSIKEIKDAFEDKKIKNFNDPKHNNYKFLYSSKEIQKEVFKILKVPLRTEAVCNTCLYIIIT